MQAGCAVSLSASWPVRTVKKSPPRNRASSRRDCGSIRSAQNTTPAASSPPPRLGSSAHLLGGWNSPWPCCHPFLALTDTIALPYTFLVSYDYRIRCICLLFHEPSVLANILRTGTEGAVVGTLVSDFPSKMPPTTLWVPTDAVCHSFHSNGCGLTEKPCLLNQAGSEVVM